ncbi:VOC family protein [Sphingomonas sp. PL-96]|uniref:VOC family protein n=1 Tax=Sphingomonas sp. PL-96 TaxID=2887201 RepID=UPI001E500703|nr:VOC family protein [Sphingomonas sp. PL-96]MCC2978462.1 VOC family protein [Sphingomonas sp. PL-96]
MFSHVTVGVSDLDRAGSFYDAVLGPLGLSQRIVMPDGGPPSRCWHRQGEAFPRFYAYLPFDGRPSSHGNGSMVAFLAPTIAAVERAHAEGLRAGGIDDGRPGPRTHYGPGYYGAYLRDPDGNKIHVVYRGEMVAEDSFTRNPPR